MTTEMSGRLSVLSRCEASNAFRRRAATPGGRTEGYRFLGGERRGSRPQCAGSKPHRPAGEGVL